MALAHPEDHFYLFFDRTVKDLPPLPENISKIVVPWHARHPILWHIWLEYTLPFFFKKYSIDVFYSGDGYLSMRSDIPAVMAIHDLAYLYYPQHIPVSSVLHYKKFVPAYLHKACQIITVSDYVKTDICNNFHIAPEKISIAGNAIDIPSIPPVKKLAPDMNEQIGNLPYFLYVGAVHPRKNIVNLIRAFSLFNEKRPNEYKLVIAGRLAWKTSDIQMAMSHQQNVVYVGSVSEEDKYALIRNALAVTYVSLFEGFGIPILEAMACGTPVITSNTTSMPEVAGGAALLADPDNPASIVMQMEAMADNPDLRQSLADSGRKRCSQFTWKASAETIYNALEACYT